MAYLSLKVLLNKVKMHFCQCSGNPLPVGVYELSLITILICYDPNRGTFTCQVTRSTTVGIELRPPARKARTMTTAVSPRPDEKSEVEFFNFLLLGC